MEAGDSSSIPGPGGSSTRYYRKRVTYNLLARAVLATLATELYNEANPGNSNGDAEAEYNDRHLLKAAREYVEVWSEEGS